MFENCVSRNLTGREPYGAADVPVWLSVGLPLVVVALIFSVYAIDRAFYYSYVETESGVIENATALIVLIPIIFGIAALRRAEHLPRRWLAVWMGIVCLGCLYIALEEVSWGQQWFAWQTPDSLRSLNDQAETNLHNMSSWFDQKPRTLLELGILVGGLILPVVWLFKRPCWIGDAQDWRWWFLPTNACFTAALMTILVRLPERLAKMLELELVRYVNIRFSELQELCIAMFLIIYVASIYLRLKTAAGVRGDAP